MTISIDDNRSISTTPARRPRCCIIASGSENVASSRIRAFGLGAALSRRGYCVVFEADPNCDILYIQKNWSWKTLMKARIAKARKALIIFDLDDVQFINLAGPLFMDVLNLADIITTDTEGKKAWIEDAFSVKNVNVIPDAIDYSPIGPVAPIIRDTNRLRVLWFGSHSNIQLFEKYMNLLGANDNIEVVVIAHESEIVAYEAKYPHVTFIPWEKERFLQHLQSCDVTCLTHDGSEVDLLRSNNKMIVSINWGVPALVSGTPEYSRTARELGVERTIFSTGEDLLRAIVEMRAIEARRDYLERTQTAVWNMYSPDAIAIRFAQLVEARPRPRALIGEISERYYFAWTKAAIHSLADVMRFYIWRLERLGLAIKREGIVGIVRRFRTTYVSCLRA